MLRTVQISVNMLQAEASEVKPGCAGTLLQGALVWEVEFFSCNTRGSIHLGFSCILQSSLIWQWKTEVKKARHLRDLRCAMGPCPEQGRGPAAGCLS